MVSPVGPLASDDGDAPVSDGAALVGLPDAAGDVVVPPPVEQALSSTSIDAPRAAMRFIRIGSSCVAALHGS
jgi:hypothetical protein